jgi:hypothetical protein
MEEGKTVDVAHKLTERSEHAAGQQTERFLEIVEVVVLALVAISTAWSGYQAARWDGRQTFLYAQSMNQRFAAEHVSTFGGQESVANSSMFTAWLAARSAGNQELAAMLERRFTPDYHRAFVAWLATDPFNNHDAPPGPGYMPQFHLSGAEEANRLNAGAAAQFDEGIHAREVGDDYVRDTVIAASVLFVIAIAQRFKIRKIRISANAIALVLLAYTLYEMASRPRI